MRVPNADHAIIEATKLRDYLLSPSHPVGRLKAAFFATAGYTQDQWRALEADLRSQHLFADADVLHVTPYGRKYRVRAPLGASPDRMRDVVSIWMVRFGEERPRFITAYPGASQ